VPDPTRQQLEHERARAAQRAEVARAPVARERGARCGRGRGAFVVVRAAARRRRARTRDERLDVLGV